MARGFFMLAGLPAPGILGMALPFKPASWQKMVIPIASIGDLDF
jgi:hypothetical protein